MRVLFVTHNVPRFDGDAAGSFVLRLAVALASLDVEVRIIAPGTSDARAEPLLEGIPIERVRYAEDADMTLAYTGTMVEQVRSSWRARLSLLGMMRALRGATQRALADAEQRGTPFDIVHVHWWFPAGLALWKGLPRHRRDGRVLARVVTMHGSDVRLAQTAAPARRLMRAVLSSFAVRTVVSTWLANIVKQLTNDEPVLVAPMPVNIHRFAPPAVESDREGILFVGRLNAQKGIADLIEAMARPALSRATLTVVADGPDRAALHTLATERGVQSRVRWLGHVPADRLVPLYQRAAAVAMPSRDEGLGLVAVEAQLCETPVVGYASGGLPDVVRRDAGGTLVPAGDIDALATGLAALLSDAEHARRLGRLARAFVLGRFSPEAVAAQYLDAYRLASASGLGTVAVSP